MPYCTSWGTPLLPTVPPSELAEFRFWSSVVTLRLQDQNQIPHVMSRLCSWWDEGSPSGSCADWGSPPCSACMSWALAWTQALPTRASSLLLWETRGEALESGCPCAWCRRARDHCGLSPQPFLAHGCSASGVTSTSLTRSGAPTCPSQAHIAARASEKWTVFPGCS